MAMTIADPVQDVTVDVTFLRMEAPSLTPARPLPPEVRVEHALHCSVPFYRYLYDTVGEPWLWWMRRTASDAELAALLSLPAISVHVLMKDGEPAGFYELDRRNPQTVNLAYFGLMPWAIGTGLGRAFLRHAVDTAWASRRPAVTVNTCTADHPRALPAYLAAGFQRLRTVREVWPVPLRLGLKVPAHLAER
ncbi:GNAT family N-acetyltransferase [Neoroseomonas soli]|uniref:GNAT family N-acetyltransferase n=1 Tax=Neoroseomonas soli TaxID=1081025 RepID=A0A9X9WWN5_9PROT|nr:GNAT family N-acetyltransferase [Neoroseomonas soli]MBR0671564.1 GNAT family N-acetyltransferase [Neoroseomonas soli]